MSNRTLVRVFGLHDNLTNVAGEKVQWKHFLFSASVARHKVALEEEVWQHFRENAWQGSLWPAGSDCSIRMKCTTRKGKKRDKSLNSCVTFSEQDKWNKSLGGQEFTCPSRLFWIQGFHPVLPWRRLSLLFIQKNYAYFQKLTKSDGSQGDKNKVTMRQCQRVCCQLGCPLWHHT